MTSLTDYQKAQLLYFSLNGTFKYTPKAIKLAAKRGWQCSKP